MGLLIGDVFKNAARAAPGRVAAVHGSETLTFGELDRRANQTGRGLAALGVRRGDRVGMWSATSLDTVVVFAGLAKLGGVFVPINPALTSGEALDVLGAAQPALLAIDGGRRDAGAVLAERLGIAVLDTTGLAVSGGPFAHGAEDDLLDDALRETDPHVVFFTSGSTGRPKGVVLSHRVNALRTHPGAMLEGRGAMVCPYPLFHMGAWTIALQQWQARDRVVFVEPDGAAICEAVRTHRATRLNCIPAVWRRILDHVVPTASDDLASIRFADTGTSVTPLELLERMAAVAPNAALRVFYGSTEAGSVASLAHEDIRRKPGSCGVPAPWAEVRVDAGGEIWVHGPLLFDGYFGDASATAEALVDGWYRTGDMADVDDEGYLTIVGRTRDVIRTGGETVAPAEVEAVLGDLPEIADVAVVGLPDPQWGEVVCAVLVARAGYPVPTLEHLRAHCVGRLAPHKHPRRVVVVDAIPRTESTRQVQRRLLVEQLT
jgi:acyl-CoA synthetase (AMP-forming)/AMP-acid ligase II